MNIQNMANGKIRLTSVCGMVECIASGRRYKEVICEKGQEEMYADGCQIERSVSPMEKFSRFDVLLAIREIPELYNALVEAYRTDIEIQLWWNSVLEVDIGNPYFISICEKLKISKEIVQSVVERILSGRKQNL